MIVKTCEYQNKWVEENWRWYSSYIDSGLIYLFIYKTCQK